MMEAPLGDGNGKNSNEYINGTADPAFRRTGGFLFALFCCYLFRFPAVPLVHSFTGSVAFWFSTSNCAIPSADKGLSAERA